MSSPDWKLAIPTAEDLCMTADLKQWNRELSLTVLGLIPVLVSKYVPEGTAYLIAGDGKAVTIVTDAATVPAPEDSSPRHTSTP